MNRTEILSKTDHTLLAPQATWEEVEALCKEALAYHTASVCILLCPSGEESLPGSDRLHRDRLSQRCPYHRLQGDGDKRRHRKRR